MAGLSNGRFSDLPVFTNQSDAAPHELYTPSPPSFADEPGSQPLPFPNTRPQKGDMYILMPSTGTSRSSPIPPMDGQFVTSNVRGALSPSDSPDICPPAPAPRTMPAPLPLPSRSKKIEGSYSRSPPAPSPNPNPNSTLPASAKPRNRLQEGQSDLSAALNSAWAQNEQGGEWADENDELKHVKAQPRKDKGRAKKRAAPVSDDEDEDFPDVYGEEDVDAEGESVGDGDWDDSATRGDGMRKRTRVDERGAFSSKPVAKPKPKAKPKAPPKPKSQPAPVPAPSSRPAPAPAPSSSSKHDPNVFHRYLGPPWIMDSATADLYCHACRRKTGRLSMLHTDCKHIFCVACVMNKFAPNTLAFVRKAEGACPMCTGTCMCDKCTQKREGGA